MDPHAVEILREIPRAHRLYLNGRFQVGSKRADRQCADLASRMNPEIVATYPNLYLDGNGGTFAWHRFAHRDQTAKGLVDRLVRRRPGALRPAGLRPRLEVNNPPVLHKVIRYDGFDVLEYAARDGHQTRYHDYDRHVVTIDHLYRVVLRDDPFCVEVRAGTAPKRDGVLEALQHDVGAEFGRDVPCLLKGVPAVDPLQRALQARFVGVSFRTRGGGAKSMSIEADEANDMTQVRRYTDELRLGSDEITRKYEFRTTHPLDGYIESATFEITLSNGSLRVGTRTSEVSIENLRRNVVALFPAPDPSGIER